MHLFTTLVLLATSASGVLALDKPLDIEITRAVDCERKTQKGDKISVHYRGTLEANGQEFDASYNRNAPLVFHLGKGQVIKGWDLGLLDMCPGEARKLTIQPEFGYGERGMGPIPPNSVLIFETELIDIPSAPKGAQRQEL